MEVKIQAIEESEHAMRKAKNDIRMICDEIECSATILRTMKSLEIPARKLKSIKNNLEGLQTSLSQMSCFLEMANETYVRTEKQIESRCGLAFRLVPFHIPNWVLVGSPTIADFPNAASVGNTEQIFNSIESD